MDLVRAAQSLVKELKPLRFSAPVTHVYNPLEYAWATHRAYLERYGRGRREVVMLGMNPGPWGMAQTGVPFGEVSIVREWLGIEGQVKKPALEHPKRPIEGLECKRSEVSGARLWGWAKDTFGAPERFFERFFIVNYCPLTFMEASGRNRTPDKLPAREREPLLAACDRALRRAIEVLEPRYVIGVGAWAEQRARISLGGKSGVTIGRILHPSPASPAANRAWAKTAADAMRGLGVALP